MPPLARLAIAAVVAIDLGAIALTQIMPPSQSVGTQPAPTPGWRDRFPTESAGQFIRPFTYAIDPATGLGLRSDATDRDTYVFEIPDEPGPAVIVQHPNAGIRMNPCDPARGVIKTSPTAEEFVTYMETIPGLTVTPLPPSRIDGRPASGIDVRRNPGAGCDDVFIFSSADSWTCCWPDDPTWVRRMWAIDVDGTLVLVTTPFGSTSRKDVVDIANSFVDSIRFGASGAGSNQPG